MSNEDQKFMQYALALADKAAMMGEIPVGAVLVDEQGNIVAEGWNQSITLSDPTAHAEIMALRQAGQKLQNYRLLNLTLYVTLEPCPMCAGAILHSRIKRLVFGASDYKDYRMNHIVEITAGVLAEECSAKISQFFQKRRAEQKQAKQTKAYVI